MNGWKEKTSLAKQGQGEWGMWWSRRCTAVHQEGDEVDGLTVSSLLKHPWDKEKWVTPNLLTPTYITMKTLLLTGLSGVPHFKKRRQSFLAVRLKSKRAGLNRSRMKC